MKFLNISIHCSKVMLCTRKLDERTNEQARSNMPPTFFKDVGIKNLPILLKGTYSKKNVFEANSFLLA